MSKKIARPSANQPASITLADVKHVADLARLEIGAKDLARFREELTSIVGFVSKLQPVDTAKVPVTAQVTGLTNVMRPDAVASCPPEMRNRLMSAAPERSDDFIQTTGVFA